MATAVANELVMIEMTCMACRCSVRTSGVVGLVQVASGRFLLRSVQRRARPIHCSVQLGDQLVRWSLEVDSTVRQSDRLRVGVVCRELVNEYRVEGASEMYLCLVSRVAS